MCPYAHAELPAAQKGLLCSPADDGIGEHPQGPRTNLVLRLWLQSRSNEVLLLCRQPRGCWQLGQTPMQPTTGQRRPCSGQHVEVEAGTWSSCCSRAAPSCMTGTNPPSEAGHLCSAQRCRSTFLPRFVTCHTARCCTTVRARQLQIKRKSQGQPPLHCKRITRARLACTSAHLLVLLTGQRNPAAGIAGPCRGAAAAPGPGGPHYRQRQLSADAPGAGGWQRLCGLCGSAHQGGSQDHQGDPRRRDLY